MREPAITTLVPRRRLARRATGDERSDDRGRRAGGEAFGAVLATVGAAGSVLSPRARLATVRGAGSATRADDRTRQICHDVSTPAVTIRLLVEQVLAQGSVPPADARRLQQVLHETERIAEICGSVLGQPRPRRIVRVDGIAAEVVRSAGHASDATVQAELRPAVVLAHAVSLRRMLANLVDNACRAAGPAGRVDVVVTPTRTGSQVRVDDSGPGPGPWTAMLRRDGGERCAPGHRAGIGLAIVARVVEECGGRVAVRRGPLGGTTVVVDFPRVPGAVPAAG